MSPISHKGQSYRVGGPPSPPAIYEVLIVFTATTAEHMEKVLKSGPPTSPSGNVRKKICANLVYVQTTRTRHK